MKPSAISLKLATDLHSAVEDVDLSALPKYLDRRAGAALVSRHLFPVSPRTIEGWPLLTRRVNGKALNETRELLAVAKAKFDAAPAIRGGRPTSNPES